MIRSALVICAAVITVAARAAPLPTLAARWASVETRLSAAQPALARCTAHPTACTPGERLFLQITDAAARARGRTRLALVNARVNAVIRYETDEAQWHRRDVWSVPFNARGTGSLDTGRGDCEDYAIAKYAALRAGGQRHLRLVVVWDATLRVYHLDLEARVRRAWWLLDYRWHAPRLVAQAHHLLPLLVLTSAGTQRVTAAAERE